MAEGRMLSKRISRSDKLAALPSDTERMFYSWLIPHLDVEGRMEVDLDCLKGDVVPKLNHITSKKIEEILVILYNIGLIILYEVNKKQYLQLVKFDENQPNLRKDREKRSIVPPPPAAVRQDSGGTPAELPHKINIREDNIREANRGVDNSQTEIMASLKTILDKTKAKFPNPRDQQQILVFVQANIRNKNHNAILHCLESLVKAPDKVKSIPAYLEAALKIENGKFNAAESEEESNRHKREAIPENVGKIINSIGKRIPAVR